MGCGFQAYWIRTAICWQTLFITAMPERMANRNKPLPVCPQKNCMPHTGNQIMAINTLFQLLALREQDPELLQKAAQILFMPDLFAALLGAEPVCERSHCVHQPDA